MPLLDEIEGRATQLDPDTRTLPYNRLIVRVHVPTGKGHAAHTVLDHHPGLAAKIRDRLRESGCEHPADLRVKLEVIETDEPRALEERPFDVRFLRKRRKPGDEAPAPEPEAEPTPAPEPPPRRAKSSVPAVRLMVARGRARRGAYELRLARIHLGRMETVVDKSRRTMRHNDVAFLDGEDEINLTVSRIHAHIEFRPDDGGFRLFDDGSEQGTRVIRDGESRDVPKRASRGVRLFHGDVIELGRARVKVLTEWEKS